MHDFQIKISNQQQKDLLLHQSLSQEQINQIMHPLKACSRKPKSNSRSATVEQEKLIVEYFQERNLKVGYQRMNMMINRKRMITGIEQEKDLKEIEILKNLTLPKLR
jgi:hypothetical protein